VITAPRSTEYLVIYLLSNSYMQHTILTTTTILVIINDVKTGRKYKDTAPTNSPKTLVWFAMRMCHIARQQSQHSKHCHHIRYQLAHHNSIGQHITSTSQQHWLAYASIVNVTHIRHSGGAQHVNETRPHSPNTSAVIVITFMA